MLPIHSYFKHQTMMMINQMLFFTLLTVATVVADSPPPPLELYMHDILGGSSPTARPITGVLGSIYSGQVPFARPLNPQKGSISVPFSDGIPLGTGLSGTAFLGGPDSGNQLGRDGLGLGFGTITVIDDYLTSAPELGSQQVGKAQGVYVASSADNTAQMMAFTALMEGGEFGDSINFFGLYKIGTSVSRLTVTGGTGKFKNVGGYAEVRSLVPTGKYVADGVETLLRITVHLK